METAIGRTVRAGRRGRPLAGPRLGLALSLALGLAAPAALGLLPPAGPTASVAVATPQPYPPYPPSPPGSPQPPTSSPTVTPTATGTGGQPPAVALCREEGLRAVLPDSGAETTIGAACVRGDTVERCRIDLPRAGAGGEAQKADLRTSVEQGPVTIGWVTLSTPQGDAARPRVDDHAVTRYASTGLTACALKRAESPGLLRSEYVRYGGGGGLLLCLVGGALLFTGLRRRRAG
ncbi:MULTISPECIES: hypothetical protein [unclassified Micromonospora]|uniref:hypothetical protein n=1 Tax=unclassified Micromonospora TaxID=2617518 RepID=UPI00363EE27E